MKQKIAIAAACAAALCSAAPARAQETASSPWQLRLRTISVSPDESSTVSNGGRISASDRSVPELDISYFFTDSLSAELILATSKHRIRETGPDIDLGSVWVLPPTLTVQYHFNTQGAFVPYLGAGVNYTMFYNEDSGAAADVSYRDGFGYAFQAGVDYKLDRNWMLNADIKKIMLNTDARVNGGAVTADVDLDPWVLGAGVGYRF